MLRTKIDWCDSTWSPVTGCLHGCEYCYARNMAHRFSYSGETLDAPAELQRVWIEDGKWSGTGNRVLRYPVETKDGTKVPYPFDFAPTLHKYKLDEPKKWRKGRNIFVCSMADLMGDWIPDEWKYEVIKACDNAPQHNYLFLTKDPLGYQIWNDEKYSFENRDNFWLGLSFTGRIEDLPKRYFNNRDGKLRDIREDYLYRMSGNINLARHKFLSIEPIMCDAANLHSDLIDGHTNKPFKDYWFRKWSISYFQWVIVGAETGRRKDKVIPKREWIENLVELCKEKKIPLFMKSSLAEIWGEPLIQEFPKKLRKE